MTLALSDILSITVPIVLSLLAIAYAAGRQVYRMGILERRVEQVLQGQDVHRERLDDQSHRLQRMERALIFEGGSDLPGWQTGQTGDDWEER